MKTSGWVGILSLVALGLCGCNDGGDDHEGYPTATVAVVVESEVANVQQAYDLAIRVQSNQGLPISGAWVQIAVDQGCGAEIQQANADDWGQVRFRFWAQPGQWVFIDIASSGFADAAVDLVVGGEPWMDVPVYLAPIVVAVP